MHGRRRGHVRQGPRRLRGSVAGISVKTAPRPIFRPGAISGIGPLRNIGASIGVSACHRTCGEWLIAAGNVDLKNRFRCCAVDSRGCRHLHHQASQGRVQSRAEWQAAMEALILVATSGGPTMFARIGVMRALNRHVERVFNPDRKDDHWGRRKLKRDE
jgi:hypothetical protein